MKLVKLLRDKPLRKKEDWMKRGAIVLANGKPGTIVSLQENEISPGETYVYYIEVKLHGAKHSNPYHPNDVVEGKIVAV